MASGRIRLWTVLVPGWALVVYLLYAQGIAAIDYDLGVAMGTQEPATQITEVGAAFWWGFAVGDLVVYLPLLITGMIAYGLGKAWGRVVLTAALGVTVYWPVVCLAAVFDARGAPGWSLPKEADYWTVLPIIAAWGVWALLFVLREMRRDDSADGA